MRCSDEHCSRTTPNTNYKASPTRTCTWLNPTNTTTCSASPAAPTTLVRPTATSTTRVDCCNKPPTGKAWPSAKPTMNRIDHSPPATPTAPSSRACTYLTDALGSVIAQLKDDQSVQNQYGYSPYGMTTKGNNGVVDTNVEGKQNASQYTGREPRRAFSPASKLGIRHCQR